MNNDLISREALKIAIEQNQLVNAKLSVYDVLKIIDNTPAVEALITDKEIKDFAKENFDLGYGIAKAKFSPKQGEWDETAEWRFTHYIKHYICNNCFKYAPHNSKTDFCPKCGAKMQKGGAE